MRTTQHTCGWNNPMPLEDLAALVGAPGKFYRHDGSEIPRSQILAITATSREAALTLVSLLRHKIPSVDVLRQDDENIVLGFRSIVHRDRVKDYLNRTYRSQSTLVDGFSVPAEAS